MIRMIVLLVLLALPSLTTATQLEHTYNALQDNNDNVYFSTNDGLIRFDGYQYLNMSDLSDLPRAWTINIAYHSDSNSIYLAYNDDGIWRIDLQTMQTSKVSEFNAIKLAVSKNKLFAMAKHELAAIDLASNKLTPLSTDGVLFDVSANSMHGYVISSSFVYVITTKGISKIRDNDATKGHIVATPTGAIFSTRKALVAYSYSTDDFFSREVTDVSQLAFAAPHHLYYIDDGFIRQMSYVLFDNTGKDTSVEFNAYRDIFVDSKKRLWAVSMSGFDIISPSVTLERYSTVSLYNVISSHDNAVWRGAKNGLFVDRGQGFKRVKALDELIEAPSYYITSINAFAGGTVISTNVGSYFLNDKLTTGKQLFDAYVINATVIDAVLYLSTDTHGVRVISDVNQGIAEYKYNDKLPSKEVLSVDAVDGITYISTAKGLVINDGDLIEYQLDNTSPVSDVAVYDNELYASTYGDGLYKLVDSQWKKLVSPDYITQLTSFDGSLVLLTKNGLHKLIGNKTSIIEGTTGYAFIPNSVTATFAKLLATSEKGLLKISALDTHVNNLDKVSYISTANNIVLGEPSDALGQTDWVEIGLTDHDYGHRANYRYQYRLDGKKWNSINTPLIRFDNVSSGLHTVEYRKRLDNGEWNSPYIFSFEITPPWYWSVVAKAVYATAVMLLVYFVVRSMMVWVQSFHRVFTANQRLVRKEGLRTAVADIEHGIALSSGDPTMHTEGLVKLNNAFNILSPLAHDAAALGKNTLSEGLVLLQTQCITTNLAVEFTFDVTLGTIQLDHDFECEVYAVVYYAILSALESEQCSQVAVHVNKIKNNISVSVADDGKGKNRFNRTINFGLGDYVIQQIAKGFNTRCIRSSSRNGNKVSICLPVHVKRGKDRRKQEIIT